jgi:hypothetical protein
VKGPFSGILAAVSLAIAIFCFYKFQTTPAANTMYMVGGIIFALVMVAFGVMFLSGRVNRTDDIHITE